MGLTGQLSSSATRARTLPCDDRDGSHLRGLVICERCSCENIGRSHRLRADWYTADRCNAAFARMPRSAAGICGSAGAAAGNPTSGSSYFDCSGYVGLISGFTRLYPAILPLGTTLIESGRKMLLTGRKLLAKGLEPKNGYAVLPGMKTAYYW